MFFLADIRDRGRALKRGGAVRVLSVDFADAETRFGREPSHNETPERRYERDWAVSLIGRAVERLEKDHETGGRAEVFQRLKPILTAEPDASRFSQIAAELKTTQGALRTALHRLRARFAALEN